MPTTTNVHELKLRAADGTDEPGTFRARIAFRDRMFLNDVVLRSRTDSGPFERSYNVCARCLVGWQDVPGLPLFGPDMDANLEALGEMRVCRLAVAILEAGKLSEDDRKN